MLEVSSCSSCSGKSVSGCNSLSVSRVGGGSSSVEVGGGCSCSGKRSTESKECGRSGTSKAREDPAVGTVTASFSYSSPPHTSGWAGPGEYNNAGMCGGPLFPSQHHLSPSSSSQPSLGTSFTVIRECTQGICEKLECKMPRGKLQEGKSGIESEENNKRRRNNNKPVVDREAVVVGNQNKAANEKKKMEKNKKAKK
jgi:hypothetical protein